MRGSVLALSLGSVLVGAQQQVPLSSQSPKQTYVKDSFSTKWNVVPDADETGQLIFNSVNGLLDHWHNAYYRNGTPIQTVQFTTELRLTVHGIYMVIGHTIIPATLAPGTLLYHGRRQANNPPDTPEWVSFDPEHSYLFGKELYTFAVGSKPLKVLYLDGSR